MKGWREVVKNDNLDWGLLKRGWDVWVRACNYEAKRHSPTCFGMQPNHGGCLLCCYTGYLGIFPPFWCKWKLLTLKKPGFHAPLVLKTLLHGTKVPKLASRAWARANSQVGAPSRKLARQVRTWRANLRLGARQMSPHRSNHRLAYHCCHWKFRPSPALAHLARRKHCSIFF